MSDYGGIIGGVVGAVVGFFAGGNVYAGWMIGSAIGGAWSTSQQVHQGPKIGEIAQQSAQEGGPRPIVFGRSAPMPGNIIADGKPRIVVKRERQSKGGPKVETESAYRTYAVGVCEGPATLLQAWRNGMLVYDAEDGSMAAENAKFLEYARWFTGAYDQMPSPDLEAVYGAGNVSAHRGTAYCVFADEDVTDQRGAWSQWVFRVFRGAAKSYTTPPYLVDAGTDEVIPAYRIEKAEIRDLHYGFRDQVGPAYDLEFAEIRDVFRPYGDWPAEEVGSSYSLISANIGGVYQSYITEPEAIESIYELRSIELRVSLIKYANWPAEELAPSYSIQSASFST